MLGCGYTTRSMICNKYRTIYIPPFVNKIDITKETDVGSKYKIYRPLLETDITKAVVDKFLFDGNLKPTDFQNADLTLKGELIEFRKDPLRYDNDDNVLEYRVDIITNLVLWDNKENKSVWEEKGFTGDATYIVSGTGATTEAKAISDAITDLARRIVERAVEEW
jgi:ABC-type uncharacterized transport system auxiliary subunit